MPSPRGCSVDFLDISFEAFAVHIGLSHSPEMDRFVVPAAGRPKADFRVYADMHYAASLTHDALARYMEACLRVTADNTGEAKIYLWEDENQNDALITFSFQAWAAEVSYGSIVPEDAMRMAPATERQYNHVFCMRLEPVVDDQHGINIVTGN